MPNRTASDEREKLDHSGHPTHRSVSGDLQSPGGGKAEKPVDEEDARGGVEQSEPVTALDSESRGASSRRTSRVRRLDSRSPSGK